jgi:DNA-binding transcriptional regulator YiaG
VTERFEYGAGNDGIELSTRIPLCKCAECGLEFTDERAEHLKHSAVCRHLKILDPDQIVAIRERYKLSQQEFAEISRIGRASLARWETRAVHQNASNDSLLFLLGFPENFKLLSNRFKEAVANIELTQNQAVRRFRTISDEDATSFRRASKSFELHPSH